MRAWLRRHSSWLVRVAPLCLALSLAACQTQGPGFPLFGGGPAPGNPGFPGQPVASTETPAGTRVTLLVPLTGPRAELGRALAQAAQLGFDPAAAHAASGAPAGPSSGPGASVLSGTQSGTASGLLAGPVAETASAGGAGLDIRDTQGTPEGAAAAARAALADGTGLFLGPLTAPETAAVAAIAGPANAPVVAFTNDGAQARPGVWPLGITPRAQVLRLLDALQAQGKTHVAGLVPQNDLGRAMADALRDGAAARGMEPPTIRDYAGDGAINQAVRDLADYANRRGPIDAQIKEARAKGDAEGRRHAAEIARQGVPPPPFDALMLADTGTALATIDSFLGYYDVSAGTVRIVGPAIWSAPNAGAPAGAWYAAPDPALRSGFDALYQAKYGAPAPAIADLGFDAGAIARAALGTGFSAAALTEHTYAGADGPVSLSPDGRVGRALAVFAVQRGGNLLVQPAPATLAGPGT